MRKWLEKHRTFDIGIGEMETNNMTLIFMGLCLILIVQLLIFLS
jgi:hypothetical protein